jgi:glutamyl-tRNA reductase
MLHVGGLGTDFRSASLRMRDALYLEKDRVTQFLDAIPEDAPLLEVVALSTCNRIEIFYVCRDHDVASKWLKRYLTEFHNIPEDRCNDVMREYRCEEAVRHLFRVVSGMESMVFGEHEILGQVREAYFHCMKNEATNSYLNRLFQQAIATGKKVRSRTATGRGVLSIASIAVEKMNEACGSLEDKEILLVGTGTMGMRALKRLRGETVGSLTLCNRTDERAVRFAERFSTGYLPFSRLQESLGAYDIIFLANANSGTPLVARKHFQQAGSDPSKKHLVIDIGAPRNTADDMENLPGVTLFCVDDLREIAGRRMLERKNEINAVNEIVEEQVHEFTRWYHFKNKVVCGIVE